MRNFDYGDLASRSWYSEIIGLVTQIHEYKGRQELYLKQRIISLMAAKWPPFLIKTQCFKMMIIPFK